MLLDHGAKINAATDEGHTALHIAAENGHIQAVKILLDRGIVSHLACIKNIKQILKIRAVLIFISTTHTYFATWLSVA